MATIDSKGGFFSTSGSLNANALRGSGYDEWQASRNTADKSSSSVSEEAASTTYSQIAEAAVVSVSSRMNTGNTGFDSQARSLVESALARRASLTDSTSTATSIRSTNTPAASSSSQTPHGSYQNTLLAASDDVREKAAAANQTAPETPAPSGPADNDQVKKLAEKYVKQHEQKTGRALSADERKQKIEEVTKYYSEPGRARRLETLLDETA